MPFCPLDIVIAVDLSGSTHGPHHDCASHPNQPVAYPAPHAGQSYKGGAIYEAELELLEGIIDFLKPGMLAGDVQVGVTFWGGWGEGLTILYQTGAGFGSVGMTNDHSTGSSLDTIPSIQDPNFSQYTISPLANRVRQAALNFSGTFIPSAIDSTKQYVLDDRLNSTLGDRSPSGSNALDFKSVLVLITDSKNTPWNSGFGTSYPPQNPIQSYSYWPTINWQTQTHVQIQT